jgi:hypothetical protein
MLGMALAMRDASGLAADPLGRRSKEMELTYSEEDSEPAARLERELALIAAPQADPGGNGRGRCPPENPAVEPITEELLIDPHPGEPGVLADGTACPPENPARYRRP